MAFDATDDAHILDRDPLSLTTPAERLAYLIAFLRQLPEERFDMACWSAGPVGQPLYPPATLVHNCGTVACIGGWAEALFTTSRALEEDVASLIGTEDGWGLFYAGGRLCLYDITKAQAIRVLEHLQATGEVNWSVVE